MPLGSLIVDATTEVGLLAGLIAVCGFLNHAAPALRGADEEMLREATVRGGLGGIVIVALINLGALWLS